MDSVLGVSPELTHKQKEFARLVAEGNTGSGAYRKAYNSKGKPQTVGKHASTLKKDDRIKAQIEAFERAKQAAAYHVPQHLRALIVNSLVEVVTDPDAKASTKVQAAKVLGTVAGVDAFVTRSEHRVIKSSEDAKGALLAKLREVMNTGATDAVMVDADSLVRELGNDANAAPDADPPVSECADDAAETPTTPDAVRSPAISIHTNPHNRTDSKSNPHTESQENTVPPSDSVTSLEDELSGNTPLGKTE